MKNKNKSNQIVVNSKLFVQYQVAAAEAAAAKRNSKQLQIKMNLPAPSKQTKGKFVVVDSKGRELGKYTISYRGKFLMPGCFMGRLS